jgi:hypothetical protein
MPDDAQSEAQREACAEIRRVVRSHAEAVYDGATIYAVWCALNERCSSLAEMLHVFPEIEAVMSTCVRRYFGRRGESGEEIDETVFDRALRAPGVRKRPKYLLLIDPEFQAAINRAKFAIGKWMLLKDSLSPVHSDPHPQTLQFVVLPDITFSWGTVPGWRML